MNMKKMMTTAAVAAILGGTGFVPATAHADVSVEDVKCTQRYPWNGLVDIEYTIACDDPEAEFYVNPVGFKTEAGGKVVTDVVDMGDWTLGEDRLMVVTNLLQDELDKQERSRMYHFDVILAKGKSKEDLQEDLQKLFPDYEIKMRQSSYPTFGLVLLMLVGSSVLLIGLFGFLRTQIQLFRLASSVHGSTARSTLRPFDVGGGDCLFLRHTACPAAHHLAGRLCCPHHADGD